jgi:tRNA threonylcarbamoyladenosine biosynthesis protein TsaE
VEFPFSVIARSEEDTADIAGSFVDSITPGTVIVLNGNLGAGKTFFVKHALTRLKIENVNSPTFAIVNEYKGKHKIYHLDFYRIESSGELFDIGINDYFNDDEAITFIEWGELYEEILPHKRIEINITINDDFSRKFEFTKNE